MILDRPRPSLARAAAVLRGRAPPRPSEAARAMTGAALGVAAAGLAARALVGGASPLQPLLVAPIGASTVLAFAIPASPLAQPRAVIGGNVASAVAGLICAHLFAHQPVLAAGAAVGLAVAAMMLLGCLHPPGGAVALGAALAAASDAPPGLAYPLVPIGLCSLLLVLAAAGWHRLTGRSYPHRAPAATNAHHTRDLPPDRRLGPTAADIDRALARFGELLDVSPEDLDALYREAEAEAHARLHAQIRCRDIMSRDLITVDPQQSARSALHYLQQHGLRSAPVVDAQGRVAGMVRRAELLAAGHRLVEAALDPFVHRVSPGASIESLMPVLSSGAAHEAMVVDENRVLVGLITQTDLLAVLWRAHLVEAAPRRAA